VSGAGAHPDTRPPTEPLRFIAFAAEARHSCVLAKQTPAFLEAKGVAHIAAVHPVEWSATPA
jgi:hypothetical protein